MLAHKIECTIARLRAIRDDGQLTEELRTRLDGAIEELKQAVAAYRGESDANRQRQCILRILRRIGWWWLLREFDLPDDSDLHT